jgi:hypothetical protein
MTRRLAPPAVFALAAAFYLYTLQPSLTWGDGIRLQHEAITGQSFILAELVKANFAPDPFPFARLGVAAWDHPLYVIIAHTLVRALPGVNSPWLVNSLSALFGAAAVATLFALCRAHTGSALASLAAALLLAVSHTFWFHAATPEVYTLHAFLLLLGLYLFDHFWRTDRRWALTAGSFVMGLAVANHLLAALALPVLAALSWPALRRRTAAVRAHSHAPRLAPALAFLLGLSPYLIQLARMLRTFPLAQVTGPAVGDAFLRTLLHTTPAQWAHSMFTYALFLFLQFGPVGLALGGWGWWQGRRAYPALWRMAAALYAVYTTFGIAYRVSDQFAFFLSSYLFWAMAIGMGAGQLLATLSRPRRALLLAALAGSIVGLPIVYAALPPLAHAAGLGDDALGIPRVGTGVRDGLAYYVNPNKRGDNNAYRFGHDTLATLPPNAEVLAEWYTDTDEYFVFRYFATVEGMRPDVELVGWPLEDINTFDSGLALAKVAADLPHRPVYLASLSEKFYAASTLEQLYCVIPEHNLYRVYPRTRGQTCLNTTDP